MSENLGIFEGMTLKQRLASSVLLEESHWLFFRTMFKATEGFSAHQANHHKIMSKTIDRVIKGEIKRLIINIPPGFGKTLITVQMLIARGFAINPKAKFLTISYSDKLANDNSKEVKKIIGTPEYQALWNIELRKDSTAAELWKTADGGMFRAASAEGAITGFRAGTMEREESERSKEANEPDFDIMSPEEIQEFFDNPYSDGEWKFTGAMVIDDATKPEDARSDTKRTAANERYNTTFASRLATQDVPVILVMQRIDDDDMSGFLLRGGSGEEWHHLCLPAEIGKRTRRKTEEELIEEFQSGKKPEEINKYHYEPGDSYPAEYTHGIPIELDIPPGPLWKFKIPEDELDKFRQGNSRVYQTQYLQNPLNTDNAVFKWSMMRPYEVLPPVFSNIVILVDPAGVRRKKGNDNTAMAVIGIDQNGNKFLMGGLCHQMGLTERYQNLKNLYRRAMRYPGDPIIQVGYERYGMQTDLEYIEQEMQRESFYMNIQEVGGSMRKEDRIQRLEPDFVKSRFFLPVSIYLTEKGGWNYWRINESGFKTYKPRTHDSEGNTYSNRGLTRAMLIAEEHGEEYRISKPITGRDQDGNIYDVTVILMKELIAYPSSLHDDMSDAVSRLYDMDISVFDRREAALVRRLNNTLVA